MYLRLSEQSNRLARPITPGRLFVERRGAEATVIAAGPLLDATLEAKGMSRTAFRQAADVVVRSVGDCSDDVANEALATGFSTVPLPEGIEVPCAVFPSRVTRTPAIETARALVLELTARLATSVSAPEDS